MEFIKRLETVEVKAPYGVNRVYLPEMLQLRGETISGVTVSPLVASFNDSVEGAEKTWDAPFAASNGFFLTLVSDSNEIINRIALNSVFEFFKDSKFVEVNKKIDFSKCYFSYNGVAEHYTYYFKVIFAISEHRTGENEYDIETVSIPALSSTGGRYYLDQCDLLRNRQLMAAFMHLDATNETYRIPGDSDDYSIDGLKNVTVTIANKAGNQVINQVPFYNFIGNFYGNKLGFRFDDIEMDPTKSYLEVEPGQSEESTPIYLSFMLKRL
ncbi:MAG: hypothetical protein IKP81_08675 [Paludibacteraceae bacterium]|nr:hypothetical protein [Paludibacteraceae bacterium]MCR5569862.1 hypothetical protein [Paludibacteraceae bacterium]